MAVERNKLTAVRYDPLPSRPGSTVTVVIPCYNYAQYLPEAVQSVLSQDDVIVDVIVVDDASTDDSLTVAERLAREHGRVHVIANERNSGAVETFNRGLAQVTGEFVVRLDADDLLTPGSLRRAVSVMEHFPQVGLVYGHPIHFSGVQLKEARIGEPSSWTVWNGLDWLTARCIAGTNTITSPEVVMRRSVVDVVGGQRALAHAHDMEMWLRISAYADVAYVNGVDQAWHREHEGSLSTLAKEPILILREVRDAFNVLSDGIATRVPHAEQLRQIADRALAREALDQARTWLDRGAHGEIVQTLCEFAEQCDPAIRASAYWRRVQRRRDSRLPRGVQVMIGVPPRARRRIRDLVLTWRWKRTGIYESLHVLAKVNG